MKNKGLFSPIVDINKLDPKFKGIKHEYGWAPGRAMMEESFSTFKDVDGNFVEQFQTTGFDARIWELYLHAYLTANSFCIDRSYKTPDFLVKKDNKIINIEAVTANPSMISPKKESPKEDLIEMRDNEIPIRIGSALYSKLKKQYWKLPHVKEKPLVFAIENFSSQMALNFSDSSLISYLLGVKPNWERGLQGILRISFEKIEEHSVDNKKIPSGFFYQKGAEYISAVLFSNAGTVAKFNRMGQQGRYKANDIRMIRIGMCSDYNPDSAAPASFQYEVGDLKYKETWGQGLMVAHNPRAVYPLEPFFFPEAGVHLFENGEYKTYLPSFHPFMSKTVIVRSKR